MVEKAEVFATNILPPKDKHDFVFQMIRGKAEVTITPNGIKKLFGVDIPKFAKVTIVEAKSEIPKPLQ